MHRSTDRVLRLNSTLRIRANVLLRSQNALTDNPSLFIGIEQQLNSLFFQQGKIITQLTRLHKKEEKSNSAFLPDVTCYLQV